MEDQRVAQADTRAEPATTTPPLALLRAFASLARPSVLPGQRSCCPEIRPYAGRGGGSRPKQPHLPFIVAIGDCGSTKRHAPVKRL